MENKIYKRINTYSYLQMSFINICLLQMALELETDFFYVSENPAVMKDYKKLPRENHSNSIAKIDALL